MDRQLLIHQPINKELIRCETLYEKLRVQYADLPRGSIVNRKGDYCRFVREGGIEFLVPLRNDCELLKELKLRRYIKEGISKLEKRITACKSFLKHEEFYNSKRTESLLSEQYKGLANLEIFLENDINQDEWMIEKYFSNRMDIDASNQTSNGLKTRSKSEAIIGTRLEDNGILFRYEQELMLGEHRIYPDFAVLLPNRRRVVYWEHLGMLDDGDYVLKSMAKLNEYAQHGFYLGINLIITYESRQHPLTVRDVDEKINLLERMDQID